MVEHHIEQYLLEQEGIEAAIIFIYITAISQALCLLCLRHSELDI